MRTQVVLLLFWAVTIISCSAPDNHEIKRGEANGYSYEYVEDDPFKDPDLYAQERVESLSERLQSIPPHLHTDSRKGRWKE